jgi:hypothetical protein
LERLEVNKEEEKRFRVWGEDPRRQRFLRLGEWEAA